MKEATSKKVLAMAKEGASKDELAGVLLADGVPFSKVDRTLKDLGISFKRAAGNWDACVGYFRSLEGAEADPDGLVAYLLENTLMDEVQAKKYKSSYFYPLNQMYLLK